MSLWGKESEKQRAKAEAVSRRMREIHPTALGCLALGLITLIDSPIIVLSFFTAPAAIFLGCYAIKQVKEGSLGGGDEGGEQGADYHCGRTRRLSFIGMGLALLGVVLAICFYLFLTR